MHEGNFTQQIVDAILKELGRHPKYRFKTVKVNVGEVYHLEPESVKMHYALLTKGTKLEGTELELVEVKAQVFCWQCNQTGPVEDHHFLMCNFCNATDVKLVSGKEITIESLEMEHEF